MIMHAYSIFDIKTGNFGVPFFVNHQQHAFRMVYKLCSETSTTVAQFPHDFMLYRVGEFDDCIGLLTHSPSPENLGLISTISDIYFKGGQSASE